MKKEGVRGMDAATQPSHIVVRQRKCHSGSQHLAIFLERGAERFVGDKG